MNKKDDRFEKFLIEKAKDEKSQFNIPFSFNNKIEETLNQIEHIESDKKQKWYKDKKYLVTAATFIGIVSLGMMKYRLDYDKVNDNSRAKIARTMDESANESAELNNNEVVESINEDIFLNDLIDLKEIESITINNIEIKEEEEISELLYLFNNLLLRRSTTELVEEEYKIEIIGEKTYIIYMKENLLLINNTVYQGNTLAVEKLQDKIKSITNS